jgi:hypothetical protein
MKLDTNFGSIDITFYHLRTLFFRFPNKENLAKLFNSYSSYSEDISFEEFLDLFFIEPTTNNIDKCFNDYLVNGYKGYKPPKDSYPIATLCVVKSQDYLVNGRAYCHPNDRFIYSIGRRISLDLCLENVEESKAITIRQALDRKNIRLS